MGFTTVSYTMPARAAGADVPTVLGVVPSNQSQFAWQAVKVSIVAPSLVTGATATQEVASVGYSRAGAAIVPIATLTTATGVNLAANAEVAFTLLAAALSLQAGDVLTLTFTHAGAGTALPDGTTVKVELQ